MLTFKMNNVNYLS